MQQQVAAKDEVLREADRRLATVVTKADSAARSCDEMVRAPLGLGLRCPSLLHYHVRLRINQWLRCAGSKSQDKGRSTDRRAAAAQVQAKQPGKCYMPRS